MPWRTALAAWIVILLAAIANGAFREAVLNPRLGASVGVPLSGVVLIAVVFVVAFGMMRLTRPMTRRTRLLVGAAWFALTNAFELSFGLLAQNRSWADMRAAYTCEGGNLWPLVLVATLVAPVVAGWPRTSAEGSRPPTI